MSSAKQYNLKPYDIINQSVSADVTSLVTNIYNKDNIGIQIVWTGTLVGDFLVQVSANYDDNTLAGTWTAITLDPEVSAAGSANDAYIDINQISAPYMRVFFDRTSGSGTIRATITGKGI